MSPNLTQVLIYSMTKCVLLKMVLKTAVLKVCNICIKISMTELLLRKVVKEVTVYRVTINLNEVLHQMQFIRHLF